MKQINILMLLSLMWVISCMQEPSQEPDSVHTHKIKSYLNSLKTSNDVNANDRLDKLLNGIDFKQVETVDGNAYEQMWVANVRGLTDVIESETLKVVFFVRKGEVHRSHLVGFSNPQNDYATLISDFFNYKLNIKTFNGRISMYNPFGEIQLYNIIENGKLIANGTLNANRDNSVGRTNGCINWYLVTTYYYSDGSTRTTSEYLFTTCNDECQTVRIAGKVNCGGGGGGDLGPMFPQNPRPGDEYEYRDTDGKTTYYKFVDNMWLITQVVFPDLLVQSQPGNYPHLVTDGPMDGERKIGPDNFVYEYDAWLGSWLGSPNFEVPDSDPFAIPITNIEEHMKCFNETAPARITIYIDQPVRDSNQCGRSDQITNVGHTFLNITQDGNSRTVGFYPNDSASPFSPQDASRMKDNAGKAADVSVSFNISAQENAYLLDYILNDMPANYNLNTFNCTNWVVEACARMGISLPQNNGSWGIGGGLCPGQFGQDMRNFTLTDRTVTKNVATSTNVITAPANSFVCPN